MPTQASSHRTPRPLHVLVTWLHGIWELVGLRHVEGGLVAARVTRAATTPVRRSARSAPVRGSGGAAPVRLVLRQRRETPGIQKGIIANSAHASVTSGVGA